MPAPMPCTQRSRGARPRTSKGRSAVRTTSASANRARCSACQLGGEGAQVVVERGSAPGGAERVRLDVAAVDETYPWIQRPDRREIRRHRLGRPHVPLGRIADPDHQLVHRASLPEAGPITGRWKGERLRHRGPDHAPRASPTIYPSVASCSWQTPQVEASRRDAAETPRAPGGQAGQGDRRLRPGARRGRGAARVHRRRAAPASSLVGEDGGWGDLVAPTYAIARSAVEQAGSPSTRTSTGSSRRRCAPARTSGRAWRASSSAGRATAEVAAVSYSCTADVVRLTKATPDARVNR